MALGRTAGRPQRGPAELVDWMHPKTSVHSTHRYGHHRLPSPLDIRNPSISPRTIHFELLMDLGNHQRLLLINTQLLAGKEKNKFTNHQRYFLS